MGQLYQKACAALLATALCISMGACTSGSPSSSTTDPSGSGTSSETAPSSGDVTAFKSKYADRNDIDLGGRTITIANQKWWKASGSNLFMDRIAENIDYFENLWNFKLEYVYPAGAHDEYHQKLSTSVLSGEPVADIAWVDSTYLFPGFMASGVIQNVSDLDVFDFSEKKWDRGMMESLSSYKGKIYGLYSYGFDASGYYTDIGWGVFFNKDYFEDNSLPELYQLVRDGEWTWDKMIEVAKQATITSGGVKTYGLTIFQDALPFINSGSTRLVTDNKDGTYTFNGMNENIIRAMEYYFANAATTLPVGTELYPWIHPHTGQWDFPMAAFKAQEAAMCVAPWTTLDWYFGSLPFEWGWVPFPKEKQGDKYAGFTTGSNLWCVLANIENPQDVAMVFDAITDVEYTDKDYEYFFENQANDDETVEMVGLLLNQGNIYYDVAWSFPSFVNAFWGAFDSVRTGSATSTSAMQSIQNAQQSLVNESASRLAAALG